MKKILFTLGLFLFFTLYSQNQLIDKILQKDVIETENPNVTTIIIDPNNYNAHGYYKTEIKLEQIDSIQKEVERLLGIYTIKTKDLKSESDSSWNILKENYLKRELRYNVYNKYNYENLYSNLKNFSVCKDSVAISKIVKQYSYLFEKKVSPPYIFTFDERDAQIDGFYNSIKVNNALPDNIDTLFYQNILYENNIPRSDWVLIARIIQYEDFLYKNTGNEERLKKKLESIKQYLIKIAPASHSSLFTGLGLSYYDLNEEIEGYKSYFFSLKTESYIHLSSGYSLYDFYPLIKVVRILSTHNDDYYFADKITNVLNEPDVDAFNKYTSYYNETHNNFDYLITKGCFELQKLYLTPFYIKDYKQIELGIISQLIQYYNQAMDKKVKLDYFTVSLYSELMGEYIERNYNENNLALLYYVQFAFSNAINDYGTPDRYSLMLLVYINQLIQNGFYTKANELIELSKIGQVTNNNWTFYGGIYMKFLMYLAQDKSDSAMILYKQLEQTATNQTDNSSFANQFYSRAKIAIGNIENDSLLINKGQLDVKNAEPILIEKYRDFQKAEDEVVIELKEANIQKINEELSHKQDTLTAKNLEILSKTDSLETVALKLKHSTALLITAKDELAVTKSARDLLLKNNDTLKKISERLDKKIQEANSTLEKRNITLANRQKEIGLLNQSIKKYNIVSWVLASLFFITSIGLAIASFLLNRSQQYATGFIQKRLLYHQAKNDNLSFENSIDLALAYVGKIIPTREKEKYHLSELEETLQNLKRYLSDLFTYQESTIVNSKKQFINLEDEIKNIADYIKIVKYKNPIDINLIPTDALKAQWKNLQIPPNILQPIIENCIKHGFVNGVQNEIVIDLHTKGNKHNLVIEDNGKGVNTELLSQKYKKTGFFNSLFNKHKELNDNKSISLSDIEQYLRILRRQLKSKIKFSIHRNIKPSDSGVGTIVEFENIRA